jgi:hypothetical protein
MVSFRNPLLIDTQRVYPERPPYDRVPGTSDVYEVPEIVTDVKNLLIDQNSLLC